MTYVEAPQVWDGVGRSVFLAGGITDCPDWQAEAAAMLAAAAPSVVVLNPRRADFPMGDPEEGDRQIAWEHDALHRATVTLFWFAPGPSVQPIALFELGAALDNPARRVVVGADPAYLRVRDVVTQVALARPGLRVRSSLESMVLLLALSAGLGGGRRFGGA